MSTDNAKAENFPLNILLIDLDPLTFLDGQSIKVDQNIFADNRVIIATRET
jgi:hypothetical protein